MIRPILALSLLVLGAAASQPDELPPLPKYVYSRYGPVTVTLTRPIVCNSGRPVPEGQTLVGCYTNTTRAIVIADSLNLWWQHFVLEHEKVHIAMRDVNASFPDPEDEEKVAWIVARYRMGEMQGHP